jgi:hypothetical protein
MASVRGILNIQSLNELTYENLPPWGPAGHTAPLYSNTLYPLSTRALRLSMHSQYIYIHCTISSYRARIDDCRKTAGH